MLGSFIDWNTLGQHTEPPRFALNPVFIEGGVNIVYAEAGLGKSLFVQYARRLRLRRGASSWVSPRATRCRCSTSTRRWARTC